MKLTTAQLNHHQRGASEPPGLSASAAAAFSSEACRGAARTSLAFCAKVQQVCSRARAARQNSALQLAHFMGLFRSHRRDERDAASAMYGGGDANRVNF
jgi:hypothetical protein